MFRVTRYPMISKTESGRVGYRKKYRVAGRVRVPAGHWLHSKERAQYHPVLVRNPIFFQRKFLSSFFSISSEICCTHSRDCFAGCWILWIIIVFFVLRIYSFIIWAHLFCCGRVESICLLRIFVHVHQYIWRWENYVAARKCRLLLFKLCVPKYFEFVKMIDLAWRQYLQKWTNNRLHRGFWFLNPPS